jgi:hypothetical protein
MKKKRKFVAGSLLALSLLAAMPTLADSVKPSNLKHIPGIMGTVASVSGNNITINGKNSKSYTVDATSAKIIRSGSTIPLSDIAVGDTLVVRGNISGETVSATAIIDGATPFKEAKKFVKNQLIKGNITFGTVTSISSSSFIINSPSKNGTSTVSVGFNSSTIVKKDRATSTISALAVGDHVAIAGTNTNETIADATDIEIMSKLPSFLEHKGLFKSKTDK